MEKVVTWTKGLFESSYQIFCNGEICGSLIFETWSNHAFGIMRKNNYRFRAKGFADNSTVILGLNDEPIGEIKFQIWQAKAVISLKGQADFYWKYSNNWLNQWAMSNNQTTTLNYKSSRGKGFVVGNNLDDELALLIGIYIQEYYARVFFAVIGFIAAMIIFRRF